MNRRGSICVLNGRAINCKAIHEEKENNVANVVKAHNRTWEECRWTWIAIPSSSADIAAFLQPARNRQKEFNLKVRNYSEVGPGAVTHISNCLIHVKLAISVSNCLLPVELLRASTWLGCGCEHRVYFFWNTSARCSLINKPLLRNDQHPTAGHVNDNRWSIFITTGTVCKLKERLQTTSPTARRSNN